MCGSLKLMRIAKQRGWFPGGFHTENHQFERWDAAMGDELLNHGAYTGTLQDIVPPETGEFFCRPAEDNKHFTGRCFYKHEFDKWRAHMIDSKGIVINIKFERLYSGLGPDTRVIIAPAREIYREYRHFVVNGKIVTSSMYKMGKRAALDRDVDPIVLEYAQRMVDRWHPAQAFVIDTAMTSEGQKIVEYNTFGCSGFYDIDVAKMVNAIETMKL